MILMDAVRTITMVVMTMMAVIMVVHQHGAKKLPRPANMEPH